MNSFVSSMASNCEIINRSYREFISQQKGNYGAYLPTGQGLICHELEKGKYSLIAMIALCLQSDEYQQHERNAIIISDRINQTVGQNKGKLWVGLIKGGLVIPNGSVLVSSLAYEDDKSFSGDMYVSEKEFKGLMPEVINQLTQKSEEMMRFIVIIDLKSQALCNIMAEYISGLNCKRLTLEQLNIEMMALPKKVKKRAKITKIQAKFSVKRIIVLIITLLCIYLGFNYYYSKKEQARLEQEALARKSQAAKLFKDKQMQMRYDFFHKLSMLNASHLLMLIQQKLGSLAYLSHGWQLVEVDFDAETPDQIQVFYKRLSYGNIEGLFALNKQIKPLHLDVDKSMNQAKFYLSLNKDNKQDKQKSVMKLMSISDEVKFNLSSQMLSRLQVLGLKYQLKYEENKKSKFAKKVQEMQVSGSSEFQFQQLAELLSNAPYVTIKALSINFKDKQMNIIKQFKFSGVNYV
ncbi:MULTISPECIES: hypothetical protein [Cysteiniphilum]|uniref:hypothetical protein n=1 Tax=Cysteiniphilum TaxID=2056696 RepID=UPI0017855146|nr:MULTISPECIES: hypothetical protein [Cysteiniphilum]